MTLNGPEGFTNRLGITFHPEADLPQRQEEVTERVLTQADALNYLDAVRERLKDYPSRYNQFLDVMTDFKHNVIDTHGAMRRVRILFCGYTDLILGFQTFLPPGYRFERHASAVRRGRDTFSIITPFGDSTHRE
ncbi:PAH2 domain-containing protein [Schizopora paradoxa]|uniref:PAH2 domain-containing protein n=1 Tax=Schizopora paradoxa TaxID=27342 RepID=A0A0H2RDQ9_9AGAM|nr:PAH2 domain-containing protein [Schizopora paradoxa]